MLVAGSLGLAAAIATCFVKLESNREFSLFWLSVAVLAVLSSLLLVRRQSLKDAEPFWSLPTRRVGQAVLPPFLVGLLASLLYVVAPKSLPESPWAVTTIWLVSYGCGLHAAGFFTARGIRLFGWIFILSGAAFLLLALNIPHLQTPEAAHYVMGVFFGLGHLAYGIYLYFTERRRNT
jgi:peptidoglycan/LPS O-acetylase OafA/YrhL